MVMSVTQLWQCVLKTADRSLKFESRGRYCKAILSAMSLDDFCDAYWDGRVFGNTFLEEGDKGRFITTGAVEIVPGISVAPVDIVRLTLTNKSGVEGSKDRGMAPLGFRVVRHGLYTIPFFVNPSAAHKSGCDSQDIDVLRFLIPHAYAQTASGIRPEVHIVHTCYDSRNPLVPARPLILAALKPKRKAGFDPETASLNIDEDHIPTDPSEDIRARLAAFEDLCLKDWRLDAAA